MQISTSLVYGFKSQPLSDYFKPVLWFLVGSPKLNIWLCLVCVLCVCGVSCVVCVWCPLDQCDALIGQRGNCTVTVSVNSCTVHVYTQHEHNIVMNKAGILAWASTLHGYLTMAISWPAFFNIYMCRGRRLKWYFKKIKAVFWHFGSPPKHISNMSISHQAQRVYSLS